MQTAQKLLSRHTVHALQLELTTQAEGKMRRWLDANRRDAKGIKYGAHTAAPADFGLDPAAIARVPIFSEYCRHFALEC